MSNLFRSTALAILLSAAISSVLVAQESEATFYGTISDSQCALNVHSLTKSHQEMLKSKSGAAGTSPSTCSIYCVAYLGGKFVLVAKGHVYHLDNQELPRKFVGEKVRITGNLDARTETIRVGTIETE